MDEKDMTKVLTVDFTEKEYGEVTAGDNIKIGNLYASALGISAASIWQIAEGDKGKAYSMVSVAAEGLRQMIKRAGDKEKKEKTV